MPSVTLSRSNFKAVERDLLGVGQGRSGQQVEYTVFIEQCTDRYSISIEL